MNCSDRRRGNGREFGCERRDRTRDHHLTCRYEIQPQMAPCPDPVIAMHPMSPAVEYVKIDDQWLIEPVGVG